MAKKWSPYSIGRRGNWFYIYEQPDPQSNFRRAVDSCLTYEQARERAYKLNGDYFRKSASWQAGKLISQ